MDPNCLSTPLQSCFYVQRVPSNRFQVLQRLIATVTLLLLLALCILGVNFTDKLTLNIETDTNCRCTLTVQWDTHDMLTPLCCFFLAFWRCSSSTSTAHCTRTFRRVCLQHFIFLRPRFCTQLPIIRRGPRQFHYSQAPHATTAMSRCFVAPLSIHRTTSLTNVVIARKSKRLPFARSTLRSCRVLAAAAPSAETSRTPPSPMPTESPDSLFQCTVCKQPYPPVAPLRLQDLPNECSNCGNKVLQRDGYVDLTDKGSGSTSSLRSLITQPAKQALFQLPLVSYAYERGWRDNFKRAGFPGIDVELDYFLDFAAPARLVLDVSCGSGLMARRLATSGEFERVIATDFSPSMLRETVALARKDVTVPEFDVVKADVSALPFTDDSVDAVHCGAALHCWMNVQDGLADIFRVLKPGGKFFATTFLRLVYVPFRETIMKRPRIKKAAVRFEELAVSTRIYRFFEVDELEYLFKAAGFTEVTVESKRACAIIRSKKPERS